MKKGITIAILNNNKPLANHFCSEHGLSVWVQIGNTTFLLDTGQTDKYLRNAQTLGIDLRCVDAIVLSHGHYDHAGGLAYFPQTTKQIPLYAGSNVQQVRYSYSSLMLKPNGFPQPECLKHFCYKTINGIFRLNEHITLFTLPTPAPPNNKLVVRAPSGSLVPDAFSDELFALISNESATILLGGCTHHGIEQLLLFCKKELNISHLTAFVGGLHLSGQPMDTVQHIAQTVANLMQIDHWIVNHCTGDEAITYWQQHFGATPTQGYAGSIITF